MMNHPEMMKANGQLRLDGYVQAAEHYRRAKKLSRPGPSTASRLLSGINRGVIAVRDRVTVVAKPDGDFSVSVD